MTAITPTRPIGALRAGLRMIPIEAKATVRDTAGLIVPLGLPLLVLLGNALTGSFGTVVQDPFTVLELFVLPLILTMVIAVIAVVNLPSFLATYRKTGVLDSLRVTPISPSSVLFAQLVVSAVQMLIGVALMIAVAVLAFGLIAPANVLLVIGMLLLGAAAMYGLGLLVAVIAPTPNASVAIGLVVFLGLGALGGMFGPVDALPEPMSTVAQYLPFGAMSQGIGLAWAGITPGLGQVIALAAVAIVGTVVAAWRLRR